MSSDTTTVATRKTVLRMTMGIQPQKVLYTKPKLTRTSDEPNIQVAQHAAEGRHATRRLGKEALRPGQVPWYPCNFGCEFQSEAVQDQIRGAVFNVRILPTTTMLAERPARARCGVHWRAIRGMPLYPSTPGHPALEAESFSSCRLQMGSNERC